MNTITKDPAAATPEDLATPQGGEVPELASLEEIESFRVGLALISPNRYQKRRVDAESVASLAENIKAHGLKQFPIGRWNPDKPKGHVELAGGHRRLAAYQLLAKTDNAFAMMPVVVQDLTDRELYETCVIENEQRAPLSAIERGRTLIDYIAEFKVTQAEAGKLFTDERGRPLGQSAVSHLVSLVRELPSEIQDLVHRGELPERAARALLPILKWRPSDASKIAKDAVKCVPEERADVIDAEVDNLLRRKASELDNYNRPWPITWPDAPIAFPEFDQTKGEPAEIPSCKGCPFAVGKDGSLYCIRPACFAAKGRLWFRHEVEAASKRTGIAIAAPGEKVTIVFAGSYDHSEQMRAAKLVKSKLACLRLAPNSDRHMTYGLQDLLGTTRAILVTTEKTAVQSFLESSAANRAAAAKPAAGVVETARAREQRINAEKELAEERAQERMAYNRGKADVLWIVEHTAELIGMRTAAAGGLLMLAMHMTDRYFNVGLDEMRVAKEELAKQAGVKLHRYERFLDGWSAEAAGADNEQRQRQALAYIVLASEIGGYRKPTDVYGNFKDARKKAEKVANKTFGVDLPAGWDTPPVHHTPINCWTCGRFSSAGTGKLTQGDDREGWRTAHINKAGVIVTADVAGAILQGVWCPEHATAGVEDWRRANLKARGQAQDVELAQAESKMTKRKSRVTPNGKAAAVATAGAVILAARVKGGANVHGHTKPAPKPSQVKKAPRQVAKKGK